MFAAEDYDPGDQVFICYGLRTNAELAMGYGMALPRNPVDFVKVRPVHCVFSRRASAGTVMHPPPAQYSAEPHVDDPAADRKVALLRRVGYGLCVVPLDPLAGGGGFPLWRISLFSLASALPAARSHAGVMPSSPLPPGTASIMVLARMNAQQVSAAEALVDKGVPLCDFDPLDSTLDDPIFGAALAVSGGGDGARTKIVRADGSVEEEGEEAESADIGSFDAFPLRDSELGSARNSSVLFPPLLASAAPDGGGHDAGQLEVEFQESGGGGGESYRRYVAAAARGKRCTGSACSLQRAVAFHYRPQCAFLWHQLDRLATGTDDARAARGAGTTVHSTGGVTSVHAWEGRDAAELPAPYGTAGGGGVNATEVVARDMDPGRPQAPMMAEAHLRVMSMSMRMLASRDTTMAVRPPLSLSPPPLSVPLYARSRAPSPSARGRVRCRRTRPRLPTSSGCLPLRRGTPLSPPHTPHGTAAALRCSLARPSRTWRTRGSTRRCTTCGASSPTSPTGTQHTLRYGSHACVGE